MEDTTQKLINLNDVKDTIDPTYHCYLHTADGKIVGSFPFSKALEMLEKGTIEERAFKCCDTIPDGHDGTMELFYYFSYIVVYEKGMKVEEKR